MLIVGLLVLRLTGTRWPSEGVLERLRCTSKYMPPTNVPNRWSTWAFEVGHCSRRDTTLGDAWLRTSDESPEVADLGRIALLRGLFSSRKIWRLRGTTFGRH